jgi:hypothetical protein
VPKTPSGFDRLVQIGALLSKRAAETEFLCEIGLDQSSPTPSTESNRLPSLDELMQLLRTFRRRVSERPEVRLALAVAAVNWAYKRAPGEGFRESFSRELLNAHEVYTDKLWEHELGQMIESAFVSHGSLPGPGSGPYRYVSPILEQAGVTEASIPAFAILVHQLEGRVSDYTDSERADPLVLEGVEAIFGNDARLGRFLKSPSGLRFVRETAHLTTWVKGDESWIATAVGYPPGFLPRLLDNLNRLRNGVLPAVALPGGWSPGEQARFHPEPSLRLDPSTGSLVLSFPDAIGVAYSVRVPERIEVSSRALVLGRDVSVNDVFAGKATGAGHASDWLVAGWPPHPEPLAVFDRAGRRLSVEQVLAGKHGRLVHLVGSEEVFGQLSSGYRSRRTVEVTSRQELDLGDGHERPHTCLVDVGLEAVRTKLAQLASLVLPAVAEPTPRGMDPNEQLAISTLESSTWGQYAGAVAGFDDSAQFLLDNWNFASDSRFAVFARMDDGRTVELHPTRLTGGRVGVRFAPSDTLCTGSLHVQPKGRLRIGRQLPPPSKFAVAKGLSVSIPDRLLGADEVANVQVSVPDGSRLVALSPYARVVQNGIELRGSADRLSFEVRRGEARLHLEVPVFRASLDYGGQPGVVVLDQGQLATPPESAAALVLRGCPRSTVRLLVQDPSFSPSVVVGTFNLGEDGAKELDSEALLNTVTEAGVMGGRFLIEAGPHKVATQTWFLDSEWTTSAVLNECVPTGLPESIGTALSAVASIRHGRAVDEVASHVDWPATLRSRIACWFDLRHALEDTGPRDFKSSHSALAALIHRVRRSLADTPDMAVATRLLSEFTAATPAVVLRADGFLLPRWQQTLSHAEAELRQRADGTGALRSWTNGCRTREIIEPRPPNSLLFIGRALAASNGADRVNWSTMLQALQTPDLDLAPPWNEVRDALLVLCLLRRGHVRSAVAHLDRIHVSWLPGLGAQLESLKGLLGKELWQPCSTAVGLDLVSPRVDDALLATALAGGPSDWAAASPSSWMHAWLGWRASVLGGPGVADREAMLRASRASLDSLPSTLERERIAAELAADSLEDWNGQRN